jgi:hypothetical protein
MDMIGRVFTDTGKYPAIKGFDYLNIRNPSFGGFKQTEEAIAWWQNPLVPSKHGIVAFCWHWRMPRIGLQRTANDEFYTTFANNNHTTFCSHGTGEASRWCACPLAPTSRGEWKLGSGGEPAAVLRVATAPPRIRRCGSTSTIIMLR